MLESEATSAFDGFFLVAKKDITTIWPQLSDFIYSWEEEGISALYSAEDLLMELTHNPSCFIWVAVKSRKIEGAVVVGFAKSLSTNRLWIQALNFKNLKPWLDDLEKIEYWAFMLEANEIAFEGSRGWDRILKPYGYSSSSVVLTKNIRKRWSH